MTWSGGGQRLVELVRDEHRRTARAVNSATTRSSSSASAGASTAVGSSSSRMRASDASALTISSRCFERDRQPAGRARPARAAARPAPPAPAPARAAAAGAHLPAGRQRDVLRHGQGRHRGEVLVHHADPEAARDARRAGPTRGTPSTAISPASGRTRPYATCIRVVLPAPFSPSSACSSPGVSVKSAPRSACTEPKRLRMPRSARAGGRGHRPVGWSWNSHSRSNRSARCEASACTPSVSVA